MGENINRIEMKIPQTIKSINIQGFAAKAALKFNSAILKNIVDIPQPGHFILPPDSSLIGQGMVILVSFIHIKYIIPIDKAVKSLFNNSFLSLTFQPFLNLFILIPIKNTEKDGGLELFR